MGTLGGGNHFIELCLDESGSVWVMLHSGSRGIGNAIGNYFIELARQDMESAADPAARPRPGVLPGRQPALRRLRRGGGLGAGLRAAEPRGDDGHLVLAALERHCPPFPSPPKRSTATTTTSRAKQHYGATSGSPAKARFARARATWASSPAAWARRATSCAARATRKASTPARTAPAAG